MRKTVAGIICALIFAAFPIRYAYASHVLPYPSFMPGNKIYRVTRFLDTLKKYWNFGSIASYKYQISLSDKYLVEAKTLFEYQQYLLAVDALTRSNREFLNASPYLLRGVREGKDMRAFEEDYREAAEVHIRILTELGSSLPSSIRWSPEKTSPTDIPIRELLTKSVSIRERK